MSLENLDNFINKFSKGIVDLNRYELLGKDLDEHFTLFKELLALLFKRKKQYFVVDQDLWKELYFKSVYFYKFQTEVNNVPIKLVTKHNQIIPFYMSHKIHTRKSTLVHFDTHSDEAPLKDSALLPDIYTRYLETNDNKYLDKAGDIVWDIGAANSGILYSTGIRDVTWCLPSWVPDKQVSVNMFLKQNKRTLSLSTTDDIQYIKNLDELSQVKTKPRDVSTKTYTKIQIGNLTKNNLYNLCNSIKRNGNKYFLDIDLDYLVCNGKPFTKSYWKETYDLSSFYRSDTKEPNQYIPRYNGDKTKELNKYNNQFYHEIKHIDKRITNLFKVLFYLKRKGLNPELISVCDSTNLQFSDCKALQLNSCNSVSNNYVPVNIALYVHTKVLGNIEKLVK
jgi:hypothetical protein